MSNYFYNNETETIVDETTGEAYFSISGYARISGRDKSVISKRLQTVASEPEKTAEIVTTTGFKTVALIPAKMAGAWLVKDNPELAIKVMEAGSTMFVYKLAGYEPVKKQAPLSNMQMIAAMATEMHEQQVRIAATEDKVNHLALFAPVQDYYTQTAWLNKQGIKWEASMKQDWRHLKEFSARLNKEVIKIPDAKYGAVNAYHKEVLKEFYC